MTRDPLDPPYKCGGTGCHGRHSLPMYKNGQRCPDSPAPAPFRLLPLGQGSAYLDPYGDRQYAPDPEEIAEHDPADGDWDWEG